VFHKRVLGKWVLEGSCVNVVLKSAFIKVVGETALVRPQARRQTTFIKLFFSTLHKNFRQIADFYFCAI